jgi:hypothetical protein
MAEFARQAVKAAMEQSELEHKRITTAKILKNTRGENGDSTNA